MSDSTQKALQLQNEIQQFLAIGYTFTNARDNASTFLNNPLNHQRIHLERGRIYRNLGDLFEIESLTFDPRHNLVKIDIIIVSSDDENHELLVPYSTMRFSDMSVGDLIPYWKAAKYIQNISPPVSGNYDRCPLELEKVMNELDDLKHDIATGSVDRTQFTYFDVSTQNNGGVMSVVIDAVSGKKMGKLIVNTDDVIETTIPVYQSTTGGTIFGFNEADNSGIRKVKNLLKPIVCKIITIRKKKVVIELLDPPHAHHHDVEVDNKLLFWKYLNVRKNYVQKIKTGFFGREKTVNKTSLHDVYKNMRSIPGGTMGGYTKSTSYRSRNSRTRRHRRKHR